MGAHSSPAAGYKILYAKFLLSFDRGFRGCNILGGKLILQLSLQLIRIHVSDVEAEVALLCPVSGFSATSAGVGSGLAFRAASMSIGTGLPGDGFEWANRGGGAAKTGRDIARGRFMDGVGG